MNILVEAIGNWIERRPDNWDNDPWYKNVLTAKGGYNSFDDRELGAKFMDRMEEESQSHDGPDWGPGVQVLLPMLQNMGVEEVTAVGCAVRKHVFILREKRAT